MAPTPSDTAVGGRYSAAAGLREQRESLLARSDLVGALLRRALVQLYDGWLADLLGEPGPGVALVAVGSLGRGEPGAGSDLDLVLVHEDVPHVAALADGLWYPIWDAGVGLDHSVRTPKEVIAVAAGDLKAGLGLLDARLVAGDPVVAVRLISAVRSTWRSAASRRVVELAEAGQERARRFGEVAFLLEPDLKQARGGMRDVHALQALAVAQLADAPDPVVRAAYDVLLDVRGELHRRSAVGGRRSQDRLVLQEQDAIAAALLYTDADALMVAVSSAARTVAYASDSTWRRVRSASPAPRAGIRRISGRLVAGRGRAAAVPARRPLAEGVVVQGGEVVLARHAGPAGDPVLVLRVAAAAARAGLPLAPVTLSRLADCPSLPTPWPRAARDELVGLLAAGPAAVAVIEALDQSGELLRLLPEWARVRSKPQRNSFHRFTVDRHLVETAAEAASLTRRVARPDLLLVGALLHDIGKGWPGDHTEVGQVVVAAMAARLGFPPADVAVLVAMVRWHLLLPDVATRRDLADPATARVVADSVGSLEVLQLLHALAIADSAATGPAAWSSWKAALVEELVDRTAALLADRPPATAADLAHWQNELVAAGTFGLQAVDDEVTVVVPDRPGLLGLCAGVLALHRLDVLSAQVVTRDNLSVQTFRVTPRFGSMPDWSVVREDVRSTLAGTFPLRQRLAVREAAYDHGAAAAAPVVRLVDDASAVATVVEVRATDGVGVLHRIAQALEACGLDIRTAHICTLGADVVDAFYVVGPDGGKLVDPQLRAAVQRAVLASAVDRLAAQRPVGAAT